MSFYENGGKIKIKWKRIKLKSRTSKSEQSFALNAIRETDMLLFVVFSQLFFSNTQLFPNKWVTKSKKQNKNNNYPIIKVVDIVCYPIWVLQIPNTLNFQG